MAVVLVVAVVAALLPASLPAPVGESAEAAGEDGPVVLLAIDAEDGGLGAHGPIENYVELVGSVLGDVSNGNDGGLLVVGGGKSASDHVTEFWDAVGEGTGTSVTYVNGAEAISEQSFSEFEVIGVASSSLETSSGGLTAAENDALAARDTDIANFVNLGGGLVGLEQSEFADPFAYVGALGEFGVSNYQYDDINPTEAGEAVGVTDALDVCCWHQVFDVYPDFLQVLATENASGSEQVAALGGHVSVPPPGVGDGQTIGACSRDGEAHANSGNGSCVEDPVNTATGAFELSEVDLRLPGVGLPFTLSRSYSSADDADGPLGRGWTHPFAARLEVADDGAVTVRAEDGQRLVYQPQGDGTYSAATGVRSTLAETADGYRLRRPDQVAYRFDGAGRLTSVADRNGNELVLSYDGDGDLATVTDTAGREIAFSHDAAGRLVEVALPDGRTTSYAYTDGLLSQVVDAAGQTTAYEYDEQGRLTRKIDATGTAIVTNIYGDDGRVAEQLDALGNRSVFAWDAENETATVTAPGGGEWTYLYSNNVLVEETDPTGARVRYDYDGDVNVSVVTDPRGNTTQLVYDAAGNLVELTAPDPLGHVQTFAYDAANNLTSYTDGRGHTTELAYDAAGNLSELHQPDGATTIFTRDPDGTGLLTGVTDPRGETTTLEYDAHGNATAVTAADGETTTLDYDAAGRPVAVVDPRGTVDGATAEEFTTSFAYDARDRLAQITDALGHTTQQEYDAVGQLLARTDPEGHTTAYEYDAARRLVAVTAPDGATTGYAYDAVGNLTARTDANEHTTGYGYDAAGRLVEVATPTDERWAYTYDAAGNLTEAVDANAAAGADHGGVTTYGYDVLNRLASITYSDDTPDVTFAYDAAGNRTAMTDGAGTATYTYDARNQLTEAARGDDTFAYAYDPVGNVTQRHYPDGSTVGYAYDPVGRIASVSADGESTEYGYDAAGNLAETQVPNGHLGSYGFDAAGRLTDLAWTGDSGALTDLSYELDGAGNPISVRDAADDSVVTHDYDERHQLVETCFDADCADFVGYAYDPVGNRLTETRPEGTTEYRYTAADELVETDGPDGTVDYDYDANGNRTQAGPVGYAYDLAGRLVEVAGGGGDPSTVLDGGFYHSLGLQRDGAVVAWGDNSDGQLGDGTTTTRTTPTQVEDLSATGVAAGGDHSLAVADDGGVAAWGANDFGQLGDGTTTDATRPVAVHGLERVAGVAGGNYHSLAVDDAGAVWSWGYNGSGQLGDGTTTSRSHPDQIDGLDSVVDVAGGGLPGWSGHSLALAGDGTVWAWGYNKEGQLGDGTRTHRSEPVQVEALADVVAIAADGDNSYALRADGTVWAWGDNSYDQLGNSDAKRRTTTPVQVDITDVEEIGAGGTHALAVKDDGTVWAWGNNNTGQLGNGEGGPGTPKTSATPVQADGLDDAAAAAGGYVHSLAALDDETAWAWGRNAEGQLGDGTTTSSRTPVQVNSLDTVAPTPSVQANYRYDGDGIRLASTTNGQTTAWQWDINAPLPLLAGERDGDGQQVRNYHYGITPLGQETADGQESFYHHDRIGSTTHLTGGDGEVQASYEYGPFGALRDHQELTDKAPHNPMRFAGEYQGAETGLYHLRAREYDPTTGSFLTPDPVAPATRDPYVSTYIYANNRPTVFTDPSGNVPVLPIIIIGVAAGAASGGVAAWIGGGDRGDVATGAAIGGGVGLGAAALPLLVPALGTGVGAGAAVGGLAGGVGDLITQRVLNGEIDWMQTAFSAAGGAVGGGLGRAASALAAELGIGVIGQASIAGAVSAWPFLHLPAALRSWQREQQMAQYHRAPSAPRVGWTTSPK